MKSLLLSIWLFFASTLSANIVNAQAYSTVSKSCGACGGAVSSNSRVGQRCPHCGVIWGRENSHTSTTSRRATSSSNFENTGNDRKNMNEISFMRINANLRSQPGLSSNIVEVIAKHETIIITQR